LAAAGFKPEFVLASDLPPVDTISHIAKHFPLPQNFQYPLVRVLVDGQAYYLNDTDQYAEPGATAHADKLGVDLATRKIETIHAAKDCGEKSETVYTVTLANDGQAQIGVTHRYYGSEFGEKNRYFSELPPEERRRYFQEIVSGVAQGARPVGGLVTKFDAYPGVEEFHVTVDHYAVVDGKYLYFDLPFTPSLLPLGADTRELPLFIANGDDNRIRAEITLPPQFRKVVIAPAGKKLSAANAGTAQISIAAADGKFNLDDELKTTPSIIAPADYPAVLKTESSLREKSGRAILLQAE
ncbi:MAG TPA: hypothetical protein VF988_14030, partial [Verrucomicrobiae bacterium]